jgi:PmbA protein
MDTTPTPTGDPRSIELDQLASLATDILERCARQGASQAEVAISSERGLSTTVRMGEVETIERQRDRGVGVTVYVGQRKGSASTADLDPGSIETTIAQALAIARYTEPDPAAGLADPSRMATRFPDLDLWHPWDLQPAQAVELARACEAAGLAVDRRLGNSEGGSVQTGESLGVYANSHGFVGRERSTRHSISCALIAGRDDAMQRDYWYDSVRAPADLADAEAVGRRAAERTLARLGARPLATRQCPVLFVPELARGLIGHFLGAVSGGAQYRKASFLLDALGNQVFPDFLDIVERPFLRRGHGSGSFDAEGVATVDSDLVRAGVLRRYVLGSYSARRLGLESTGNAGGVHNLQVTGAGGGDFDSLLKAMDTGLVVTELMGQGVNAVTGDYSRGAAGFWVERGQIVHPVEEVTIAGQLLDIYRGIVAVGADVDPRSHILCGSILVERMTLAGA